MKDDREALRKWFLQNAYKEYIIINITGNRGGTDYYWMDLIVAPNIESKMGYISYLITPYGEETREQFALCGIKDGDLKVIDENILELPEVNRKDLEGAGYYKQKYLYISPSCEEKSCSGQFFVLIDNHVNSAADGFAMFCKATEFARLVGQNTKGDGGGSNAFMVRLPKSNLLMRFRAMMSLNPDGRSNAECGTIPDIVAKSPRGTALNPLNACLEYIRTQGKVP